MPTVGRSNNHPSQFNKGFCHQIGCNEGVNPAHDAPTLHLCYKHGVVGLLDNGSKPLSHLFVIDGVAQFFRELGNSLSVLHLGLCKSLFRSCV